MLNIRHRDELRFDGCVLMSPRFYVTEIGKRSLAFHGFRAFCLFVYVGNFHRRHFIPRGVRLVQPVLADGPVADLIWAGKHHITHT